MLQLHVISFFTIKMTNPRPLTENEQWFLTRMNVPREAHTLSALFKHANTLIHFIAEIKPHEKIHLNNGISKVAVGLTSRWKRYMHAESRCDTRRFLEVVCFTCLEKLPTIRREVEFIELSRHILNAIGGIRNLQVTYSDDLFVTELQFLVEQIQHVHETTGFQPD